MNNRTFWAIAFLLFVCCLAVAAARNESYLNCFKCRLISIGLDIAKQAAVWCCIGSGLTQLVKDIQLGRSIPIFVTSGIAT